MRHIAGFSKPGRAARCERCGDWLGADSDEGEPCGHPELRPEVPLEALVLESIELRERQRNLSADTKSHRQAAEKALGSVPLFRRRDLDRITLISARQGRMRKLARSGGPGTGRDGSYCKAEASALSWMIAKVKDLASRLPA